MIDFHSSTPLNQGYLQRPIAKNAHPNLLFSARPNIQQLPFLNKLKLVREMLISLKNQKLRKSLYGASEGCEKRQREGTDIFRHEKAKLSVMDLISEEGKFEELSNTIQSNLYRQSISPIPNAHNEQEKKQPGEFMIAQQILEAQKQQKENEPVKKQTILTRKNRIASHLNELSHELEETYLQVEELQQIFETLCCFYAENKTIVDTNLKLKQQRDLIQQKIQQFQSKIFQNQRQQIVLQDKTEDFLEWYKLSLATYLKDLIAYNSQNRAISKQLQTIHLNSFADTKTFILEPEQLSDPIPLKDNLSSSSDSHSEQIESKSLEINLKFRKLKSELEKIKADKKTAALNKNKQKKAKIQSHEDNIISKIYTEIYTL